MKRTIQVEGFIYNEKKDEILAVRRRDLSWGFPGGAVEKDQTMEEALIQKVKQQANVDISIDSLLFCRERRTEWEHVCTIVFKATAIGDFDRPINDESVFRVKWLSIPTADGLLALEKTPLNKLIFDKGVLYDHLNEFPVS